MTEPNPLKNNQPRSFAILRVMAKWVLWVVGVFLLVLIGLVFFIQTSIFQDFATRKINAYLQSKTQSAIAVGAVRFDFDGALHLQKVFIPDFQNDTLLFSNDLKIKISYLALLQKQAHIKQLQWQGVKGYVAADTAGLYNFDFLLDAFVAPETENPAMDAPEKEDTTDTWGVKVDGILLRDFDLAYKDGLTSISAAVIFNELALTLPHLDFEKFNFGINRFFVEGLQLNFRQTKPSPEDTTTTELPPIVLALNNLSLKNSAISVQLPDGTNFSGQWTDFQIIGAHANLEQSQLLVQKIGLQHSSFFAQLPPSNLDTNTSKINPNNTLPLTLPDWDVKIDDLDFYNTGVVFIDGHPKPAAPYLDPQFLRISNLDLRAQVAVQNQTASLQLTQLQFDDASGFRLEKLQLQAQLQNHQFSLYDFVMATPNLQISAQSALTFQSLDVLMQNPTSISWEAQLETSHQSLVDLRFFPPNWIDTALYAAYTNFPAQLRLMASGSETEILIQNFDLSTMASTHLNMDGLIKFPFDSTQINVVRSKVTFQTTRPDLQKLMAAEPPLPDSIQLQINSFGTLDNFISNLKLQSDWGIGESHVQLDLLEKQPTYDLNLAFQNVHLPKILADSTVSKIDLTAAVAGAGFDAGANAKFQVAIQDLIFQNYAYQPLVLDGAIHQNQIHTNLNYTDKNAQLVATTALKPTPDGWQGALDLQANSLNFKGLKLTKEDLWATMQLAANFETTADSWHVQLSGKKGRIEKNSLPYEIGPLSFDARSNSQGSFVQLRSDILNLLVESNLMVEEIAPLLQNQILGIYNNQKVEQGNSFLTLEATVKQSQLLSDVLIPGLEKLTPGTFNLHIDETKNLLDAAIVFPEIIYGSLQIKDLKFDLDNKNQGLDWALGFSHLEQGPLLLQETRFGGHIEPNKAQIGFLALDSSKNFLYQIEGVFNQTANKTSFRLDPKNLVLNKIHWDLPDSNNLQFSANSVTASEFMLTHQTQKFGLQTVVTDSNRVSLLFDGFPLSALTALANAENLLVDGNLTGTIDLLDQPQSLAFLADIVVEGLTVLNVPTGRLALRAENLSQNTFNVSAQIKGKGLDFNADGTYQSLAKGNFFDVKAQLNQADLAVFESFTNEFISETSGNLSGSFLAKGFLEDLVYNGSLQFNKARFKVNTLNTYFELSDERMLIRNNQILFNNFSMRDQRGNPATLNGAVDATNPALPRFDLRLMSKNFQLLNSNRTHNDLFFGDLFVDLQLGLTGNVIAPKVKTNIRLNKGTSVVFIVPENELAEIERDGVVQFENMQSIQPQRVPTTNATTTNFKGLQLEALLEVDRETEFKVVVDERSGDFLQMRGKASLLYEMAANGRTALFGQYEVNEGRYELSFYDLVRRRFDFKTGSTINWTGDPLGAALDLSAIYNAKAAPRDLMAAQLSGADEATRTKYNQKLPFEVYLNIKGAITTPEISFKMDMPQNSRGEFGGNVYAQLQQLNEDPSQLNKQVFALLVLGSFMPETGGTATGATSAMVRSSVSQLLSDQLNTLSDKYIKGVDIDLGLDSYKDYRTGTAQDRTQLNVNVSKQLLDERLVISVGSNLELEGERAQNQRGVSDIIGNVNVEYLLTPTGHYRLKAFRRNQFEGVLDGQIITTGVSLRYSKEFNQFREIFKNTPPPQAVIVEDAPDEGPDRLPTPPSQQETPYRTHEQED